MAVDDATLDALLARLAGPLSVQLRLDILRHLAVYWHGPVGPGDAIPDVQLEGLALPLPLQWWYRWAGRRTAVFSSQNRLLAPHELEAAEDGKAIFYVENQGVYV